MLIIETINKYLIYNEKHIYTNYIARFIRIGLHTYQNFPYFYKLYVLLYGLKIKSFYILFA